MAVKPSSGIRKFEIADVDKILKIEQQAFPKTAYSKETFLEYASRSPYSFLVVEAGEDIAGYIIFDTSGHIHSTAVKSNLRRKGFGKMLFMYAARHTKKLWLEVRAKNTTAIEFYKSMGMEVIAEIPNYYGNDDALLMVLT